jgi:hypothetical protein
VMFRVVFVLFLLAAFSFADEDEDIRRHVEDLAHPQIEMRIDAQRQLMKMGRHIAPKLRALDVARPEIRLRIRAILGHYETLLLSARIEASRHALGANVEVVITLQNFTRDTYLVPILVGNLTPFGITIGGTARAVPPNEMKFDEPSNPKNTFVSLAPGQRLRARTAIHPQDLPDRRAGSHKIVISYLCKNALLVDSNVVKQPGNSAAFVGDQAVLKLYAAPITLEIATRAPEDLERALGAADTRGQALVELRLRNDEAVLPILRAHAADPDLRLHAVIALGAKGAEEDLSLIRNATKDKEAAVRSAATAALRYFPQRKARVRLCLLAKDAELRTVAVTALRRGHKHARTIDTYIEVLRSRYREGPWVPQITAALKEWTGQHVRNTPNAVAAFKRWWTKNRAEWIEGQRLAAGD